MVRLDNVALDGQIVQAGGEVLHDGLADREDHRLAGDLDKGAGDGLRTTASPLVGLAQLAALQPDGAHLAVGAHDLVRYDQVLQRDLLVQAFLDLLAGGGHLFARASVGDGDLRRSAVDRGEAGGGASRVEGDVATADHDHPVADRQGIAEVEGAQELDRLADTRRDRRP